jgi:hypothetical protein
MAERIRDTEQTGKDPRVIDNLIHEIVNDLQVIRMEADLQLMGERSKRGPQCVLDAAQNIERLLGEVREYFLLPQ